MRQVIDTLAVLSFAMSSAVVGGLGYVYFQRDALMETARERVTQEITGIVTNAIGDSLGGGLTESLPVGGDSSSAPSVPGLPF